MHLLDVAGLTVEFDYGRQAPLRAVDDLSFTIREGETIAIVGESGSGKSTAALSILQLIPDPPGRIAAHQILFDGEDLATASETALRAVRGQRIGMIFQDPMMALNPVYTVERQIGEVLRLHRGMSRREAEKEVIDLLRLVGVPAPVERAKQFPHNLSGGMRQRVMIAMALACRPRLLIADEPTTALDVTVQAQVLALINDLKQRLGMAVLLITHDLGIVAETADRVLVMYAGRKVEEGRTAEIFDDPLHPYARGLLKAARWESPGGDDLWEIPGTVPSPLDLPRGCAFAPRCADVVSRCRDERPNLGDVAGRAVRCFVAQEGRR